MMKFNLVVMLVLASISSYANLMHFEVDSIDLNRKPEANHLNGDIYARDILIKYDNVEFDLTQNGELFLVDASLYNNKIAVRKDNLNFATNIPTFPEIDLLNFINAKEAIIEFSDKGFYANGPELSIGADKFLFAIQDVDINCVGSEFTFNLDEVCLKNMLIKPRESSEFAKVEIKQNGDKPANVNILGKEVNFSENRILIDAQSVHGYVLDSSIEFNSIKVDCFKDPTVDSFNIDLIFSGCLQESRIAGDEIKLLREGMPFNVFYGEVYFEDNHLGLEAKELEAKTKKGHFIFSDIKARCLKTLPSDKDISADAIYVGCLRHSEFSIERVSESKVESPKNRIRDLKINVTNHRFNMTAKLKALIGFKFRASGKVEINEELREVTIKVDRAKVAGLRATKLVLKFVMKFITSDSVSLDGDTITIKY